MEGGLERWGGSRTLRSLASCAGQFEPRLARGSSWTRRRSVVLFGASVRKGAGVKRWDASEIAAYVGSRS